MFEFPLSLLDTRMQQFLLVSFFPGLPFPAQSLSISPAPPFLSFLWLVFHKGSAHLSSMTLASWNTAAFRGGTKRVFYPIQSGNDSKRFRKFPITRKKWSEVVTHRYIFHSAEIAELSFLFLGLFVEFELVVVKRCVTGIFLRALTFRFSVKVVWR